MIEKIKEFLPWLLPLLCVFCNGVIAYICKHFINKEQIRNDVLKKQVEEIGKECFCMKCRLDSYREADGSLDLTTFKRVVPQFKYDEATGKTYKSGDLDLQELINSSAECALDKILERLGGVIPSSMAMPGNVTFKDEIGFVETIDDDLDILRENQEYFNELRSRYDLDASMSDADVMKYLESVKASVSNVAEEIKKKKEVKESA